MDHVDAGADSAWTVAQVDSAVVERLMKAAGLPRIVAELLAGRDISSPEAAREFLSPELEDLHDPFQMLGMSAAVDRLRLALLERQAILIYGDYDVDGTIATVLLKVAAERAAASLGAVADIRYHIPHRIREGYGMQDGRIQSAAEEGVRLIISVDTGIRAFSAAAEARRLGIDMIITDHHLHHTGQGVPDAFAVLNPNQPGCEYPCKDLCGAGIAFKLAQALLERTSQSEEERRRLREKTMPSFLKLLSLATIADAVPLTGENRVIAKLGLRALQQPSQPGLRALMHLAALDTTRPLSASDVGFRLAPRINVAGRMDVASDVVEMFLARDATVARTLAEKLNGLNEERRSTEAEALRTIEAELEAMAASTHGHPECIVLDNAAWHRGVIGILASRIVDRTGRPALVLAHENGEAYGSGRSVAGFHLLQAITEVNSAAEPRIFSRFGGHAHAVGFSLPSHRVAELREQIVAFARSKGLRPDTSQNIQCDVQVRFHELTAEVLDYLEQLGPFGQRSPQPLFLSRNVRLSQPIRVVKDRHLRLTFEEPSGSARFGAVAWSRRVNWAARATAEGWAQGQSFDIAFRMQRNWHPDFGGWEMELIAVRSTTSIAES